MISLRPLLEEIKELYIVCLVDKQPRSFLETDYSIRDRIVKQAVMAEKLPCGVGTLEYDLICSQSLDYLEEIKNNLENHKLKDIKLSEDPYALVGAGIGMLGTGAVTGDPFISVYGALSGFVLGIGVRYVANEVIQKNQLEKLTTIYSQRLNRIARSWQEPKEPEWKAGFKEYLESKGRKK